MTLLESLTSIVSNPKLLAATTLSFRSSKNKHSDALRLYFKPDPEIFNILLEKYDLKASECLFLDDRKDNVVAASNLGFKTIEVKDSSKVIDLIKEKISEV